MKRIKSFFLIICMSIPLFSGCLTDLTGWDLSACDGEFGTCFELFFDNQEKILGGSEIIEIVLEL